LEEKAGPDPLGFFTNPQVIWYAFTNHYLSWASHAIFLSMMSYQEFLLDLKVKIFSILSR